MRLRFKLVIVIFLVTVLLTISGFRVQKAKAWGPITHIYYTELALKQCGESYIVQIIRNNKEWFYCGLMYPDVTVIYYYTQWVAYSSTHAWEFQRRLWQRAYDAGSERAMAFALGVGVHLLQDCITHNYWIPQRIRTTFVQNNIIHPLSEGFVETRLAGSGTLGALARTLSINAFSKWNEKFDDGTVLSDYTPVELCEETLGYLGFEDEAATFNTILQGGEFYTKGYAIPEAGGLWTMYRWISDILKSLPFITATPDADPYINKTIEVTVEWFMNGPPDNPQAIVGEYDPTGEEALKSADAFVVNTTIMTTVAFFVIVFLYYYRKVKKS